MSAIDRRLSASHLQTLGENVDPRLREYRLALVHVRKGLGGKDAARERHRRALLPYCEYQAERTPPEMRRYMILALVDDAMPLGIVALAFKASEEDIEWVREHQKPLAPAPMDMQTWLATMPYKDYLKTDHWQHVRRAAIARAEGACQLCSQKERLEVHHRTYERRGFEKQTDVTVVCADCHRKFHGKTDTRRVA